MSIDYKITLNMPKTDFDMKANLNIKEPKYQQQWLENKIYQKVLEKNKNNALFFLHDGPPYANGQIHVGHALNKTLKDIIVRYKTIRGFYVPFIPGWDTHGLPIEIAMLKANKDAYKLDIIQKRLACKQYALDQVEFQKNQFLRIGMLSDFEKKYLTLDHDFEINQLRLFEKMVEKNLIFNELKPVYWSWSSKSALADAEIEYENVESDSIYFTFNVVDGQGILDQNTQLIIWTTTPWTIPSNLAVAVNPNLKYLYFEYQNNKYLVNNDLFNTVCEKLSWNQNEIKQIHLIDGNKLENISYQHMLNNKILPVILANYVSNTDGTGLVHNAPGFGTEDYLACKNYNITPYCPINEDGKFINNFEIEQLSNLFYIDANPIVIDLLKKSNNLLKHEKIIHSAAHDWRTKKPVIYRATKQWFVNLASIKDNIFDTLNKDVTSINNKSIDRMKDMIKNRYEWCISRQRIWGVPIPIIYDDNREPILDIKQIKYTIDQIDSLGTDAWFKNDVKDFLHHDYKHLKNPIKEMDIMDVWFDSGSSHMMFKSWVNHYPADLYLEGNDQYRGWFNSSLITGVIYNNHAPYKQLVHHGFILDEHGFKMSKSKGNTVDPLKVFNEFGSDIFRLWVASSEYGDDLRIGTNILKQFAETYRKIRNTLFKYSLSIINDFDNNIIKPNAIENRYILKKLETLVNNCIDAYDKYDFAYVTKSIYNFTYDLSIWYYEIIKDPIYCLKPNDPFRREIQSVIYLLLESCMMLLAPIMPHTCEEVYQYFNKPNKKESVHLESLNILKIDYDWTENDQLLIDKFFILKDEVLSKLEELRKQDIIKKNNEASVIIPEMYIDLYNNLDLKRFLNVANISIGHKLEVKNANLKKCLRCWNHFEDEQMANDEICNRCNNVLNN